MSIHNQAIDFVLQEIRTRRPPASIDAAFEVINPTSVGMSLQMPVAMAGNRMFRIRKMNAKPSNRKELGAPPLGVARLGRLNLEAESVLYLADSPDTAFAEARAEPGEYCLSEWRTNRDRIGLVNGGLNALELRKFFGDPGDPPLGGTEHQAVAKLFCELFSMNVIDEPRMYWWSIACGRANGFSATCERTEVKAAGGNTHFSGRFPFAGIAYLSVRKDREAVNFCFNDVGQTYVNLDHAQWVRLGSDGSFTGLDISTSWDPDGELKWEGRPPHFVLGQGRKARVIKTAENVWTYEDEDGLLPQFR